LLFTPAIRAIPRSAFSLERVLADYFALPSASGNFTGNGCI